MTRKKLKEKINQNKIQKKKTIRIVIKRIRTEFDIKK
jgi:hypothetical protein